jgi:hypothetical protein
MLELIEISIDNTDTEIDSVVLSYGTLSIQYRELRKNIVAIL